MKYTREWAKEKCFDILKTLLDGNIEEKDVDWDDRELMMTVSYKIPVDILSKEKLIKIMEKKYGEANIFNEGNEDIECDIYIDNQDFQIWIEDNITVRLYYAIQCINCTKQNECDKYRGFERPKLCEEFVENKETKDEITHSLIDISEIDYNEAQNKEQLLLDYLNDYQEIRKIIFDNWKEINSIVNIEGDKNGNVEFYKAIRKIVKELIEQDSKITDLQYTLNEDSEVDKENIKEIRQHLRKIEMLCNGITE